jgi:hypothetical protein
MYVPWEILQSACAIFGKSCRSRGEAPERRLKGEAPERRSKGKAPKRRSKGEAPERRSKGEAPERRSKGKAPERRLKGEAPERRSKGEAPEHRSKGKAPERRSKGEAPERRSKGEAPGRQIFFECGLSCPSKLTIHIIRVRGPVPRIISFGPAVPPNYSSVGFGPSNRFLRASNAFTLFECRLQSLESFYSG